MSGIIGSKFNHRGSGLVGSLGTDGQHLLSSGAGKTNVFESVSSVDLTPVRQDITTLALKQAVNENKAAFNLPNTFIDQFENDTGIGTETDVDRNSSEYVNTTVTTNAAFTNDSDTGLLLHFDNNTTDSSSNSVSAANTDVTFNTGTKKFGTHSALFNGSSAYLQYGSSTIWQRGTGNFTMEVWYYASSSSGMLARIDDTGSTNQALLFGYLNGGNYGTYMATSGGSSWALANSPKDNGEVTGAWTHYALERHGNNWHVFKNGSKIETAVNTGSMYATTYLRIGGPSHAYFNGYLDEFRFSTVARYEGSNFTPNDVTSVNATGTLIGIASVPSSAQTKVSGVALYTDTTGTATIGTDLKIYFTCNGGTNWTEAASYTAVTPVFSSGVKMIKLGETTCTSGSDVRYKAVWANQSSGSKDTRLVGIGVNY